MEVLTLRDAETLTQRTSLSHSLSLALSVSLSRKQTNTTHETTHSPQQTRQTHDAHCDDHDNRVTHDTAADSELPWKTIHSRQRSVEQTTDKKGSCNVSLTLNYILEC